MTSGGSYPLTVEALRCRCGALPVMEWTNWGNSHRVICPHCGAGSDLEFITYKSVHHAGGVYTSSRERALDRWKQSLNSQ